jgi:uncharacterized membrane protein YjfL (UPF0719 family)
MPTTLEILYSVGAILMVAGLMLIARVVYARFAGYDVDHQLTEADNPAVGTAMFGYLAGVVIVLVALLATEGAATDDPIAIAWDLGELLLYGLIAIVLLKLSGYINDRFVLHRFENKKELVDDRNVGAGAVLCGSYLASALILAGAFHGRVDPEFFDETPSQLALMFNEICIGLAFFGCRPASQHRLANPCLHYANRRRDPCLHRCPRVLLYTGTPHDEVDDPRSLPCCRSTRKSLHRRRESLYTDSGAWKERSKTTGNSCG